MAARLIHLLLSLCECSRIYDPGYTHAHMYELAVVMTLSLIM